METQTFSPDIEKALADFLTDHPHLADRHAALSDILKAYFSANGYLPTHQEGKRPDQLDATNDD
ncbi:hypothetical protein BJF93_06200 [Xaviernesmea oryzae]|uniref:Uncharacterized protein n=1 Tax=Xaviernesmea oryzae TaxID=464029 RepID=A0A1Q9ARZ5_9HYPH|nr:hypothetical protein [Xaviernesmea oryzae]OLP58212.1 hypothetical protein BJF93_06200 [Xaviernesmea oryzae]SEL46418.1 hypothetical protein SAMN04487976_108171 [Xaviernesmea oryzae]